MALLLMVAGSAGATLLEPLGLEDLAARSDVVVHGRVEAVQVISHGPRRMPVTLARILILEVIAGNLSPRRQIVVSQPGGAAGGIELDYAGRPLFTAGSEAVLFLEQREPGRFITVGLAQGKFDIAAADAQGRRPLSRDLNGAALSSPPALAPPADLDQLRRRIKARPRDLAGAGP